MLININSNNIKSIKRIENTQKYVGHCLNTYLYFSEKLQDIDATSVESINSIKDKYPELRSKSKNITFRFNYGGSWQGLVSTGEFDPAQAKEIYDRRVALYADTTKWLKEQEQFAIENGYMKLAFGLKIRTPSLYKCDIYDRNTYAIRSQDTRTALNAVSGQSYCQLTERLGTEMRKKIREKNLSNHIRQSLHVHDALYFIVRRKANLLAWLNKEIVNSIAWKDLDGIRDSEIELTGKLALYSTWANEVEVSNNVIKTEDMYDILYNFSQKRE